jgi:hypothetical protein
VLSKAVKPPTPDAAKLAAVVSQQQLAMQHVRMQLARMVKKAHPAQVGDVTGLALCVSWVAVPPAIQLPIHQHTQSLPGCAQF